MLESILSTSTSTAISLIDVVLTIIIAFIAGAIISITYMKTYHQGGYSQNFAMTIILLPSVISIIIMLIGSDVAKAFSLAGTFSIIRFRSAPGEPKDIVYVLFAMAAGLAAGAGVYIYAIIFTVILCLVMLTLNKTRFGCKKSVRKELRITIPEDLDYETSLDDVFEKHTMYYELKKVKTSALGSLFQLTYEVELLDNASSKALIDDLRCRNGNLNISLSLAIEQQ